MCAFLTFTQGHLHIKIKIMVFSEITGPMKVKFNVEPPCLWGNKILCAKSVPNAEHGSQMLKNLFLQYRWADIHETRYVLCSIWDSSRVCSSDGPRTTWTNFTARSVWRPRLVHGKNVKTVDILETMT